MDVYKVEDKESQEEGPSAKLSSLKVTEVLHWTALDSVILEQTINFGKSYLLLLNKNRDYYYELSEKSVNLGEKDEYKVQNKGIEGVYKKQ